MHIVGGRTFYSRALLLLDKNSGACDTAGDVTYIYISKYMR